MAEHKSKPNLRSTAISRTSQIAKTLSSSASSTMGSQYTLNENGIPPFESLPLRKGDPFVAAWGLYGDDDELGTLNRLTPDKVVEAAKEIRTGNRVGLDWELHDNAISSRPFYGRQGFDLKLLRHPHGCGNDDVWTFNTQASTQWDGLRHVGFVKEQKFYNGVTQDQVHEKGSTVNGIQAWAKKGIVGRGILVDYHSWREANDKSRFDAFTAHRIPVDDLRACLEAQGTEVKFGDILFVRSGFQHALRNESDADMAMLMARSREDPDYQFCGVDTTPELLKWIWENFSAVAGDQPAFEAWPFKGADSLHAACLASWGMPIGELFDLEALAEVCKKEGRWSFFLTSEPCNVPGAVASPPNALAIF